MRLVGTGLRAIVVTLDPGRSQARPESPASMLRSLGHDVTVVGYDLAELDSLSGVADVAVVEAGEHLEIGRHAIKRLRQRPDLVATRILLCLEVARVSGLDPEMGADDFILIPVSADEMAARLRQLQARDKRPGAPLQVRYGDVTLDCEMRQAYEGGNPSASRPTSFSSSGFSLIVWAACSPGRSSFPASGAIATSVACARSTPTCSTCAPSWASSASGCSRSAAWATSSSAPTPPSTASPR